MRLITGKSVVAAIILIAAALIATTARAQSCSPRKLCTGTYTILVGKHSSPRHSDITFTVVGVDDSESPEFVFAPLKASETMRCADAFQHGNGDALSCAKEVQTPNRYKLEIVTIGRTGGAFCSNLRTNGPRRNEEIDQNVIKPDDCPDGKKCACFLIAHYCRKANDPYTFELCTSMTDEPPSEGTGSGGSP